MMFLKKIITDIIILHSTTVLSMQTHTYLCSESDSLKITIMGFEIKTFAKASNIMLGKALNNSQACFLNNALSAFPYLHH